VIEAGVLEKIHYDMDIEHDIREYGSSVVRD
jgi:hypothetical protein